MTLRKSHHSLCVTLFTLLPLLFVLGCDLDLWFDYSNGFRQYEERNLVKVPGGVVNAAGGYLILSRSDLSMDTVVGSGDIRATYNSVSGRWLWNFQISYDGLSFVDETGAEHDLSSLADGDPIPGTKWTKVDDSSVQTRGGLAYTFGVDGRLSHVAWATMAYPRLRYTWSAASLAIDQCTAAVACLPLHSVALEASGDPSVVSDARTGRSAEYDYDAQGRLSAARDARAVEEGLLGVRYEYTGQPYAWDVLSAVTNSDGERIEYTYMAGGPSIRTVTSIGAGNPTHTSTHTFSYAPSNRDLLYPITHTNPLGGETRYLFDARRRLREVELVSTGEKTLYTWEGLRPASRTDPAGVTTLFAHVDDELASTTLPSGNIVTYLYQPAGLNIADPGAAAIQRIDDSLGTVEERDYDAFGRVEEIRNGEAESVSFTYHSGSTVASVVDAFGVARSFPLYGTHGHWLEVDGPAPDQRSFDPVGNALVASMVLEVGGVLARSWNGNRQLSSIQMGATDELHQVTIQSPIGVGVAATGS